MLYEAVKVVMLDLLGESIGQTACVFHARFGLCKVVRNNGFSSFYSLILLFGCVIYYSAYNT